LVEENQTKLNIAIISSTLFKNVCSSDLAAQSLNALDLTLLILSKNTELSLGPLLLQYFQLFS
jgi:hypothetical protein